MIAYLIHVSLIWLLALAAYELWLRRTTFHSANRWYLNASLLLGMLLPLYSPSAPRPDLVPAMEAPMRALALREQRLQVYSEQVSQQFNVAYLLAAIALAGALIQVCRMLREAVILLRWRRAAFRTELYGTDVFITGKEHGPFSAFRAIFLSDIDAYSEEELRFILAHEQAHLKLRHSIDKSLMLLVRCLLWWHPLVYIYYSRLCLVQEFQADSPLRSQAPAYGRFLIDANMSVAGIGVTHQFFHSPLKTRIRMLQRFATRNWKKLGYGAALILLAAGSFLWTNKSIANKKARSGNVIVFNGNRFEMGVPAMTYADGHKESFPPEGIQVRILEPGTPTAPATAARKDVVDTTVVFAPVPADGAGELVTVTRREVPVKMNGTKIYEADEVDQSVTVPGGGGNIVKLLIESHLPSLAKLPDGTYSLGLSTLVVDAEGKIVYYENSGVTWYVDMDDMPGATFAERGDAAENAKKQHAPNPALRDKISKELAAGLASIKLTPGIKAGKPVIAQTEINNKGAYYMAKIEHGQITAINLIR